MKPPRDGYYPGEELNRKTAAERDRLKKINGDLLEAVIEHWDLIAEGYWAGSWVVERSLKK